MLETPKTSTPILTSKERIDNFNHISVLENLVEDITMDNQQPSSCLKDGEGSTTNQSSLKSIDQGEMNTSPSYLNKYYVYAYLDTRYTGSYNYDGINFEFKPIYIGKGCDKRAWAHLFRNDRHPLVNKIKAMRKLGFEPKVMIVRDLMNNIDSLMYEEKLIKMIGRIGTTGTLCNLTDGGVGGCAGYHHTEEHKLYVSKIISKRNKNNVHGYGNRGKKRSEAIKQLLASYSHLGGYGNKGIVKSDSHRQAISKATMNIHKSIRYCECLLCGDRIKYRFPSMNSHFVVNHYINDYKKMKTFVQVMI